MKLVVLGGCGTAGTDIIKDLIWGELSPRHDKCGGKVLRGVA